MSFRELTMIDVREVLRRMQAGQSARQLARDGVVDRKTAGRYFEAARQHEIGPETDLTDALVREVAQYIQTRPEPPPTDVRQELQKHRATIEAGLTAERPLRLVRVQELLARDGVEISYSSLRRYAHAEFGWKERRSSVRIDDPPAGEEAQIDFGHMGFVFDATGKRRKLWALVVTLTVSRYMFVWPTLEQTTAAVCAGLDAAWRFFGGVTKRVLPDNMSSAIVRADPLQPTIQPAFLEYAQARGFFVDPARVRRPQDKARVENQNAYVRERCFDGEHIDTVDAWRTHCERWCRDVAGARVHGTTRLVPRDVYESAERPHMLPPPTEPFDVPVWTEAKVHPDHHVQVARALYSVPTAYLGRTVRVRLDSSSVRLYLGSELIKIHTRVEPGRRSTDASDYPVGKADYALRSVDRVRQQARLRGAHVGDFVAALLEGPLPWAKMRQAYALLRLCDRYGEERVDQLCARALAFEVFDVVRLERMLKAAQTTREPAAPAGRVVLLPVGRFARSKEAFVTRATCTDREEGGAS